jgi:uncharacterized lipoprotein YmbA
MFVVVLLTSCSLGGKKTIDKLYYRFPEPVISLTSSQYPLIVKRPKALGILGNRPMVAQNNDGGLIQMQHNFWLESPKILLFNYLNKVFNVHLEPDQLSKTNYLNVEILHLEKKQDTAILELKFVIKNKEGVNVFNKTYFSQKKLAENNIPQFVNSVSEMLKIMTKQLVEDIK